MYFLNFLLAVGGTIFNFLKIAQTSAFQPPPSGLRGDAVPIRDRLGSRIRAVYTCMYCRYIHCTNSLTHIYIYYTCSNDRLYFLVLILPLPPPACCFCFRCMRTPFPIGTSRTWVLITRRKGDASILRCPFFVSVLFCWFFFGVFLPLFSLRSSRWR